MAPARGPGADLEDIAASWEHSDHCWLAHTLGGQETFHKPPVNFTYRKLLGSLDWGWLFPHLLLSLRLLQSLVRRLRKQAPLPTVTKATWKIKTYANQQWLARGATPLCACSWLLGSYNRALFLLPALDLSIAGTTITMYFLQTSCQLRCWGVSSINRLEIPRLHLSSASRFLPNVSITHLFPCLCPGSSTNWLHGLK